MRRLLSGILGTFIACVLFAPMSVAQAETGGASADHRQDPKSAPAASPAPTSEASSQAEEPRSNPQSSRARSSKSSQKAKAARTATKTDPGGNNGSIKIDGAPYDAGHGNEPHVGCVFRVVAYGFDAGQHANIVFLAIPPSGSGSTALTQNGVLISTDAAGGGQDVDEAIEYDIRNFNLVGVTPAAQGYHFKVMVDATEAPGGAKQKAFWVDCPPPVAGTGPAPTVVAPTVITPTQTKPNPKVAVLGNTTVQGATFTIASTRPHIAVLGVSFERGQALPLTGLEGRVIFAAALALIAAGFGIVKMRKREVAA